MVTAVDSVSVARRRVESFDVEASARAAVRGLESVPGADVVREIVPAAGAGREGLLWPGDVEVWGW